MVAEATRGVKFVIKAELDPNVSKPFDQMMSQVEALQKRMAALTIPAPKIDGVNGSNGSSPHAAAAKDAEKAAAAREKAAEKAFKIEAKWNQMAEDAVKKRSAAEKREIDKLTAERKKALDKQMADEKKFWDDAIKQAKQASSARAKAILDQQREVEEGWKRLSSIGRDSFDTSTKLSAGMAGLSAIGSAAMPKDSFAAGLKNLADQRASMSGFAGLGKAGLEAQEKLNNLRKIAAKDADDLRKSEKAAELERKKAAAELAEAQEKFRERVDASVESVSKLARGFAQLGLIGETDLHRITNTMLGVQGTIDTVRGGVDALRQARGFLAARGGGAASGAAGAVHGGSRLASLLGLGGGAAGTGGAGGAAAAAGGAGLATAGAAVAALLGTIAAGVSGFFTVRAARTHGFMGGFQFGSPGQIIGDKSSGFLSSIASMGHGAIAQGAYSAFAPYGMTSREQERWKESFLDRHFGKGTIFDEMDPFQVGQRALSDRRIERLQKEYAHDKSLRTKNRELRNAIDEEILPLEGEKRAAEQEFAAQQHGLRMEGLGQRRANIDAQLNAAFGRQQAAHGEQLGLQQRAGLGQFVSPLEMARAVADQAREEGEVARREQQKRTNLEEAGKSLAERHQELLQERNAAQARLKEADELGGSQVAREHHSREVQEANDKLAQNARERLQTEQQIKQVGVDAAQRQLSLQEQSLANAKQTAATLRQQGQSAMERFGQLNPVQQRATLEAARQAAAGKTLQKPQLDLLRSFPELAGEFLRKTDTMSAQRGGFDELKKLFGFDRRLAGAEAQEKQLGQLVIDNRAHISATLDANTEKMAEDLVSRLVPILKAMQQTTVNEVERKLKHAQAQNMEQGFNQGADRQAGVGAA